MNTDLRQMVRELLLLRTAFNDGIVLNIRILLPHSVTNIREVVAYKKETGKWNAFV
jgi:hypothetical protein